MTREQAVASLREQRVKVVETLCTAQRQKEQAERDLNTIDTAIAIASLPDVEPVVETKAN